jgi:hypothetical protein
MVDARSKDAGTGCIALQTFDCTSKRDCTPSHDSRECNRCLVSILGHCVSYGNDPDCEASKAAQNRIYDTQKASCEADNETERLICEAVRAKLSATVSSCAK